MLWISAKMVLKISTHAPRTGSDILDQLYQGEAGRFQPTLPARGATEEIKDKMEAL